MGVGAFLGVGARHAHGSDGGDGGVAVTHTASDSVSGRDEADLTWYFGPGACAFERSTFGAMLAAIERDAYVSEPCGACGSTGIVEASGAWCPRCSGAGSVPRRKGARSRDTWGKSVMHVRGARGDSQGYTPDDGTLTRYAVLSRRVAQLDARHFDVLATYYGDAGARWGRTRHGRAFAIAPLTQSGARLVEYSRSRGQSASVLAGHEILGVEAELDRTQPRRERRALLDAALRQAEALYCAAARAWNATSETRRKRR